MKTIEMETPANFSFDSTVISHGWYVLAPFRWDRAARTLHRTEELNKVALDLKITHQSRTLIIRSEADLSPHRSTLLPRIHRMFQLDLNLREFHALCRSSDTHRAIARAKYGRLLCGSTLFEDAVKVITTTNTTWRQTVRMVQALVDRYGAISPTGARAFPTAESISNTTVADLREHIRLGYRAVTVHALARGIADGSLDLREITNPQQSSAELFRSYRKLPGIGPYGAAHLLAMDGRHDFIAVDTEFRKFVSEHHFRGRKVSDGTMVRRYTRWGNWRYLAYWSELWMSAATGLQQFEKTTE